MNFFCKLSFFLITLIAFNLNAKQPTNQIKQMKREVHLDRKKVEGWCSNEKMNMLMDLVIKHKPEVVVEIGVFGGASILPIAKSLKLNQKGKVYAIDPWKNSDCLVGQDTPNKQWWSTVDLGYVYRSYKQMIKRNKLEDYVVTLKATSEMVKDQFEEIDILHIDGNHSEEAVTKDVDNYFPKVKKGGYIICDDALWVINGKPSTAKAYKSMLKYCKLIREVDNGNCILLKRTKR